MNKYYPLIVLSLAVSSAQAEQSKNLDAIVVSAPIHKKVAETIHPVNILAGDELTLKQGTTLGETLSQELGIHSSSFGSSVGRPVIRGQVGTRVQVLQNSVSGLDVSSLSPDHANSTEGLFAKHIEVLRGPASLLYGGGAIGGIVNVIDNRIPLRVPESSKTTLQQRFNTVSDQSTTALEHDGGVNKWAWHVDGFRRDSNNYDIPNSPGFIENTDAESWGGTLGTSWVDDWGMVGFSINHLDNNYGVPIVDELVRLDVQQTRYDFKGEVYEPFSWAETVKFRLAYNDYDHAELEDGTTVGTVFENEAVEGRVELVHRKMGLFDHGAFGLQVQNRDFSAVGEEALVPPSNQKSIALFALEDIHKDDITYELGLRVEHQKNETEGFSDKQYTPINASVSAQWFASDDSIVSLAFTHAQRAPTIQELFSNGAHHATEAFEIGDENLDIEKSNNLELRIESTFDTVTTELNLFHNWSTDYIFERDTGQLFDLGTDAINPACVGDCLSVFQTTQEDARFYGFEAFVAAPLWKSNTQALKGRIFTDYVRGKLDKGGNVPRMPPLRYGVQLDYTGSNNLAAGLKLTRAANQTEAGNNETPTKGYLLLDANLNYRVKWSKDSDALFFVKGHNLLDETIRQSTSFLKDVSPQPGRGAEIGVKLTF